MAAGEFTPGSLHTVADGVFVRQDVENITWADMGEYTLVIDALEQANLEDTVMNVIQETVGNQAVKTLINTHTHPDHVALNKSFQERHGAEIINGHTQQIPDKGLQVQGEKRTCLIYPVGGVHTSEDAVVWFPAEQVLCTGDIFGWGMIPCTGSLTKKTFDRLLAHYEFLINLNPVIVVPGHGPMCNNEELQRCRDYFILLHETLQESAKAKGAGKGRLSVEPPEDMGDWWGFVDRKHERNVRLLSKLVS